MPRGRKPVYKEVQAEESDVDDPGTDEGSVYVTDDENTEEYTEDEDTEMKDNSSNLPPVSKESEPIKKREIKKIEPIPRTKKSINDWSVQDVFEFIKDNPGYEVHAEGFLRQEIDGEALQLLKSHHLLAGLNMKLGPAVKLMNKISVLK